MLILKKPGRYLPTSFIFMITILSKDSELEEAWGGFPVVEWLTDFIFRLDDWWIWQVFSAEYCIQSLRRPLVKLWLDMNYHDSLPNRLLFVCCLLTMYVLFLALGLRLDLVPLHFGSSEFLDSVLTALVSMNLLVYKIGQFLVRWQGQERNVKY